MFNEAMAGEQLEHGGMPGMFPAAAQAPRRGPLDTSVLNQLRSLQRPGQSGFLKRLAEQYLKNAMESLRLLREAVQRDDARKVHEVAHKLKSSSASMGAKAMAAMLGTLETMGSTGAIDGAREMLGVLDLEFAAVSDALRMESSK